MRPKTIVRALVTIFLLYAIYLVGPRVEVDETITKTDLPSDIDQYVKKKQTAIVDIKPNTTEKIIWARRRNYQTEFAILYFHGFSASRTEIDPVPQMLARRLGANLYYARFTGHGRYSINATKNVTVNDWLNDAVEALEIGKRLGRKIIILSSSTGGTISTWLNQYDPESIHALVMLSPNFMPQDKKAVWITRPWGQQITKLVQGKERAWGDGKPDPVWTNRYKTEFLFPMMGIVTHVQHYDFQQFNTPLLIFYSKDDKVVNHTYTKRVFSRWGTDYKRMIEILNVGDKENHILAGNLRSPENNEFVTSRTLQFISLLQYTAWR